MTQSPTLASTLARLETRWGRAAISFGAAGPPSEGAPAPRTHGALALAAANAPASQPLKPVPPAESLPSGWPQLDALLGPGGLPRAATASLHGATSSGKTTLALHWLASSQAAGGICAYLDLGRAFDPLEAVSRGIDPRWLLVLRGADEAEGFDLAAALVGGHAIDLLVVDLRERMPARHEVSLRRLAAHARRAGTRLIVLEPAALNGRWHAALAEAVSLRLELEQRGWLRLGRDIVGRRIAVSVAKNRFGPPGRTTEIEIRYLADGELASPAYGLALADRVA